MVMLNYINPELAKEFMVYAHATPDVKRMLRQIEDISWRLTGTPNEIKVAYGKGGSWPFYWYMRTQYPNSYYYDATPDAAQLRECPVIIAGRDEWNTVEGMLEEDYITTDYKYLWWPIEDYKGLTGEQVRAALADPQRRAALWDIIWARDYLRYAQLKNPEAPFTLKTWPHREDVRFYVRRDLAAQVWRYRADGATDATTGLYEDPYQDSARSLTAASVALLPNAAPRGLAVAADGTLYVADAAQHRVWHITAQGEVLHTWGEYGVAPGQFNAPGDVAVDAEGHVYVADTWNHRVQVFDEEGQYLRDWGRLMQINDPQEGGYGAFYGPRGIAVNADGEIYVTDTGNRRVQIFDAEGTFLRAFGRAGAGTSELDEPVGIAVSPEGEVYIADTWNHRVQVFTQIGIYAREWDVVAWGSGLPDEKPYLAYDDGRVYVSDPANQRVLAFEQDGPLLWSLSVAESLTFPLGLAVADGVLYVTDAETGQVLGYRLP
jgi:DNA-binding beta-propeller fold protein YncE